MLSWHVGRVNVGNDRPREITGGKPLATSFLQHLDEAGWSRDGVDAVVCTHLHVDHVGWNTMLENGTWVPTFPNARYFITRREYDFWSAHDDEEQRTMLGDSVTPIRLTPSTGHTPGHVSVMIESAGERAVITGDMAHHPCQLAHPDWTFGTGEPEAAVLTRSRLFAEWADQGILVIGTHFAAPTAGYVVRDGAAFRFAV